MTTDKFGFKPMLAAPVNLSTLRYPVYVSQKLDGIRASIRGGVVYSRSNKPIPNKHIQAKFGGYTHLDGEFICGDAFASDVFQRTTSTVMSLSATIKDVKFYAFDFTQFPEQSYRMRLKALTCNCKHLPAVEVVQQDYCFSESGLLLVEEALVGKGAEGVIIRDLEAPYKYGRSTTREQYLLKLKRYEDAEATVIGFEERMHNGNTATVNELGRTSRSSHAENLQGRGDLGALRVKSEFGVFNIGTGFSDALRKIIWESQDEYVGQLVKYRYFPVGMKDLPRHPVFLGFRSEDDL